MVIKRGNTVIRRIYRGSTLLTAVYRGSTLIWQPPYATIYAAPTSIDQDGTFNTSTFGYRTNVPTDIVTANCNVKTREATDDDFVSGSDFSDASGISSTENTSGGNRSVSVTIYEKGTQNILDSVSWVQSGVTWTTHSCTCTVSSTSYNTSYLNSMMVYTTSVTVTSYASQTSSEGDSRTVEVTPTASISNSNIITGVSFTKTATNTYKMTVGYKRNVSGSSTVTIITAYGGKIDTATYTINVAQQIEQKTMTLVFQSTAVQKVFLFSGIASTNLSTNALKAWNITTDNNTLLISWTSTLQVNSPTGSSAQINEGQQFYVYYSASEASYINQCILASTQPTLEAGATVYLV